MQTPVSGLTAQRLPWLSLGIALLVLVIPTAIFLWGTLWNDEAYAHGPIVLGIIVWLMTRIQPPVLGDVSSTQKVLGFGLIAVGCVLYVIGRSQSLPILDVTALLPLCFGAVLVVGGTPALRVYWFPLLFLVFLIPLPGFVLDMLTLPLKERVSSIAEALLYSAGLPIGRSGVTLTIGQYQLMVADACSGLNSMFSLSAMGVLYMFLMGHHSVARNVILLLLILPIAFLANLVRVIFLILLTYYFGDEAGQGFLHGFAGIFLFVIGLVLLFAADSLMGRIGWLANRKVQA